MPNSQTQWGAEALWQQLEPLLPGLSVEVLARAESTNTMLLDRARAWAGAPDGAVTRPGELDSRRGDLERPTPLGRRGADIQPCLLVAEQQTRGRGRLGRDWVSSAGASLTFSLALVEALDPLPAGAEASPRLMLKWPNDLWLAELPAQPGSSGALGRKLGGILIETVNVGHRRLCVVGVGLNVRPQAVPELPYGYACLAELQPEASAPAALAAVALPLVRALLRFEAEGFAPLRAAYARRDLLVGQPVTTTLAAVPEGVAEGVDERGALRVRSGDVHSLVSGEVSVRLQGGAA